MFPDSNPGVPSRGSGCVHRLHVGDTFSEEVFDFSSGIPFREPDSISDSEGLGCFFTGCVFGNPRLSVRNEFSRTDTVSFLFFFFFLSVPGVGRFQSLS